MKYYEYECGFCERLYARKQPLKLHLMKIHFVENNPRVVDLPKRKDTCTVRTVPLRKSQMHCPVCEETFPGKLQDLDVHLEEQHHLPVEKESHVFDTVADFESWKKNEEKKEKTCFTQYGMFGSAKRYYKCHCSGKSLKKSELRKKKSGKKTGFTCPARIFVKILGSTAIVEYVKTHLGHTPQIRELSLAIEDRIAIMAKIEAGVPFDRILKDVREEANMLGAESMQRIHLLNRKDLHNISAEFHRDQKKLAGNDFTKMWLESQGAFINSPVIFSKMQGNLCQKYGIKDNIDHTVMIEDVLEPSQFAKEQLNAQRVTADMALWLSQLRENTTPSAKKSKFFKEIKAVHKLWLECVKEDGTKKKQKSPRRKIILVQKRMRSSPSTTTKQIRGEKNNRCRSPSPQEKDLYVHSGEDHNYCLTTTIQGKRI